MTSVNPLNPRHLAFSALRSVHQGAFADMALDRLLHRAQASGGLSNADRRLATELVYGCVRRQRTLDVLITQFARKPADQQPLNLRLILQLGLYQLRYLSQIPPAAAVNTTVDLAKAIGLPGLTGVVNGIMRQYVRRSAVSDPLHLPDDRVQRLAIQHSYPDWIVETWLAQFGLESAEQLCQWFNQPPHLDLRINPLRTSIAQVVAAFEDANLSTVTLPFLPQGLRIVGSPGAIQQLPGFGEGWWTVQDSSAQLVSHLLDPQPDDLVIDACAAPGGKTTHLAELMGDRGVIWACDRSANRLKKVRENAERLRLISIQICAEDSRTIDQFTNRADRVLLDVPCSNLGTLNRHADARWRQTPDNIETLAQLQQELLSHAATWVKPGGHLVYSTCTLHPAENEAIISAFLRDRPDWHIQPPSVPELAGFVATEGWMRVLPHQHDMDGFFMAHLRRD